MRGLYAMICMLLMVIAVSTSLWASSTEMHAKRWADRVASYENARQLNLELLRAHDYSEQLVASVRMLANENGLLCERDAATMAVVCEYEGENRRLKLSLDDACGRLQEQEVQINELIDENDALQWRLEMLEDLIETLIEEEEDNVQSN